MVETLTPTRMMYILNTTLTMDNTRTMTGSHNPQGLAEEVQDQQATQEGTGSKTLVMVTAQGEMIPEAEEKMNIDKMEIIEVIGVQAEKEITMGQPEPNDMVMAADKGRGPEDTARRFQTWGILLQATPQKINQDLQLRWIHH